ncbi:Acetyltransferase (GNAT) family protein [Vibrio aerogenes CECT 7868]|uniref:Acetyltransferase (GNAT) family protein n=1 Tax=Vibrio aerogenes CECT 7868 TaxID=1216006 RepID=A0A1M5ZXN2_9VIBR|nr:GNAT family N-acetyltransferase [Vibrio aerogenes]SHI29024.1 Acetyltransferase (GNAT) family protein [Vibrio aerogenes CECT 7868]
MEIISERLKMRPLSLSDREFFESLYTDPRVTQFCFDQPEPDEIEQKFQSRLYPWNSDSEHWLCLLISQKNSGEPVGITGFFLQDGIAEVGFLLSAAHHGRQFGTESLKALIQWTVETCEITAFQAVVTEGNIASERVLEKCGFELTEVEPDAYMIGGKLYADHLYTLIF